MKVSVECLVAELLFAFKVECYKFDLLFMFMFNCLFFQFYFKIGNPLFSFKNLTFTMSNWRSGETTTYFK